MSKKPSIGLSTWLAFLALGAVVPLLLFAGATLFEISKTAQASRDRGQADTVQALALALDGEVRSWKAALTALAASRSLQQGRLADFYEEARRVAAQHEGWIVLTDATTQQRINTLRPYGDLLPKTSSPDTMRAIFEEGKPVVTDLFFGKVAQRFIVAVAVPVRHEGKVVYALDMSFGPERLSRLLATQGLPASWVTGITDRQNRVVARSRDPEARVGKLVQDWLSAAFAASKSGLVTGPLTDDRPARVAFHRMQEVPWVASLAVPVAELPSMTHIVLFLLVGAVLGCLAIGVALYTGRKIAAPVARLADAGATILRGDAIDLGPPSGIREVRELQEALGEASIAVQGYYQERERVAIAAETAAQKRLLETVLEQAGEGIIFTDAQGKLLYMNRVGRRIIRPQEESRSLDLTSLEWGSVYDATGRLLPPEEWPSVKALRGEPTSQELRIVRPDGSAYDILISGVPLRDETAQITGVVLTFHDISDRKRAELEIAGLAKFSDENPHPVLRVDAHGTILYANRASLPLCQVWRTGKDRMLPTAWRDTVRQVLTRGMPQEIEIASGERIFSIGLVPIRDPGYVNLYARDITERNRAEEALKKAHAELEQRVRERTAELSRAVQTLETQSTQLRELASELTLAEQRERQRLATVLHDEHQQLLVAARLRVILLERGADPRVREACREVIDVLREALEHSRSLTQELSPPILQTGGLAPALDWVARWMKEKHQLTVDVQADPTAVPDTEGLTILLFQAARELLFNVVKHAQTNTARVALTRRDDEIRLVVADTGVGFDPASLRAEGGPGGGFGLFSIRQRLELLGGRLDIESILGQGSRFTIVAPLHRARAAVSPVLAQLERPERASGAPGAPLAPSRTGKIRVLVVDDHAVMRQGLARLLMAEPDIEVVGEAADGKEGAELTRRLKPDVILMDVSMPVLNGIEATRLIHAECPSVRVIGLSMFEEGEQATTMRDAGAVAYVAKSGPAKALLAAIRASRDP